MSQQLERPRLAPPCASGPGGSRSTSAIWLPTCHTGFSDDCGCWKIIEMRSPRILRISLAASLEQVLAVEEDLARLDAAGRGDEAAGSRATVTLLPQPDSPDQAQDLAAVDVEVDAVHRPHHAVAGVEGGGQALTSRRGAPRCRSRRHVTGSAGVEGVAQAVAEEVEGQDVPA